MKVLFVSSGNSDFGMSPIIKSQAESLKKKGVKLEYFTIKGKGISGYLRNIRRLQNMIKDNSYDIVHSHYSLSSYISSLAGAKNQVVSLMGSDVYSGLFAKKMLKLFNFFFWKVCIVKSEDMQVKSSLKSSKIIPNGVDLDHFKPICKTESYKKFGFDQKKKNIIFVSNPARKEKNFQLVNKAFSKLRSKELNLKIVSGVKHSLMPYCLNAADVLLLTSKYEGSPNVIKEAMACNCPIVCTDVGDVRWVLGDTKGCYITSFNPEEVADKIRLAFEFATKIGRTIGRERIKELKLDAESVAEQIIEIYSDLIREKNFL